MPYTPMEEETPQWTPQWKKSPLLAEDPDAPVTGSVIDEMLNTNAELLTQILILRRDAETETNEEEKARMLDTADRLLRVYVETLNTLNGGGIAFFDAQYGFTADDGSHQGYEFPPKPPPESKSNRMTPVKERCMYGLGAREEIELV